MRKLRKTLVIAAAILLLTQTAVFAVDTSTGASQENEPSQAPTATPAPAEPSVTPESEPASEPENSNELTKLDVITPDSALYPLKLLVESINLNLTFDEYNKAQLMITYADNRLEEAYIMQDEENYKLALKLVEKSISLISDANTLVENSDSLSDEEATAVLMQLSKTGESASLTLEFMANGEVSQEDIDSLLQSAEEEIIESVVKSAFITAKDNFFDAKDAFKLAQDAYRAAKESGDEDAIAAAYEALVQAEALKDELESVKDEAENIKDAYGDEDDDDEGDGKALGHDKNKHDYDDDDDEHDDDDD